MQIMTDGSLPVSLNNSLRILCVGRALKSLTFVLLFCICHCSKSIILRDRHQLVTMIIKQFTSHIRISAFSIMRFPLASRLNCMNGWKWRLQVCYNHLSLEFKGNKIALFELKKSIFPSVHFDAWKCSSFSVWILSECVEKIKIFPRGILNHIWCFELTGCFCQGHLQ